MNDPRPGPLRFASDDGTGLTGWRARANDIIYGHESVAGRAFDVALIVAILASVSVVMFESVAGIRARHGPLLKTAEWTFTVLFTLEYGLRLLCVARPSRYAKSFFGVVDVLAILPTYASLFLPGAQFLLVIRTLRILRVFRVLKLVHYLAEIEVLMRALRASGRKIIVFVYAVLTLVVILGSLMYLVEGPQNGFSSIPRGVYWAIVTLTTVGYGDISPQTNGGQFLASVIMILGYGIIAVPTGIVTVELNRSARAASPGRNKACEACGGTDHDDDARHCKHCGARL